MPSSASTGPAPARPSPAPSDRLALVLAEWFGCGRSPVAPGTVGTVGALPVFCALRLLPPLVLPAVAVGVSLLGIWASGRAAVVLREDDPQRVVIDEVAGVLLALSFVPNAGPTAWLACVLLFRLLDIKKPWLIDRVQNLEPAGLGIMADDLLAGVATGALVWGALWALGAAGVLG